MNQKPLDLTKPVQTRDGRKARVICTDMKCAHGETIAALVSNNEGNESLMSFYPSGNYATPTAIGSNDLINTPTRIKRDVWINVYPDQDVYGYSKKVDADTMASVNRLACVKVTIDCEEGEGL